MLGQKIIYEIMLFSIQMLLQFGNNSNNIFSPVRSRKTIAKIHFEDILDCQTESLDSDTESITEAYIVQ